MQDERRRQLVDELDEVAYRAKRRSLGNIRYAALNVISVSE